MAHRDEFVTQRIVPLEGLASAHDLGGDLFQAADVLAHAGKHWLPVRDHRHSGPFHLREVKFLARRKGYYLSEEGVHGFAYRPLLLGMTAEDVEGATYAYDHGTHWSVAHCSPDEQVDFAAAVEHYVRASMQDAVNRALAALALASGEAPIATARDKADALGEFARAAGKHAHVRVVKATLGHWHRDPHQDHTRDLAVFALEAVLALWDELGKADTNEGRAFTTKRHYAKAEADAVITRLKQAHAIEWRHVRQKRLDDAAAAAGTDPVAGFEYVYAASLFPAVITGAANLPSPTWPFDALRNGRVLRGSFFYTDGEPVPTRFQPWAIRFKRPVPEGTKPGASIGSVPWVQEAAYQPPIPESSGS